MKQHYVSQVLLRRFKIPERPLQRYRVQTQDWTPRSSERVFSARAWNQLRCYGQLDDSLEKEFSKVETVLPETFRFFEEAATLTTLSDLPPAILRNISQYCSFLWLTSPFAKAKAPIDFLGQINHDLKKGEAGLLRQLSFSEKTIQDFCSARTKGYHAVLFSDDSLQVVYRIQFRQMYPFHFGHFHHWTEWTLCTSPIELPLSDIALVQLHMEDQKAVYYVLPVSPTLLLKGKCKLGPQDAALPPQLHVESLSTSDAEYWLEVICLSAVTELVSSKIIPNIEFIRERAKSKGIRFPKIVNPQRGAIMGLTEFNSDFGLRMVSQQEYVRYVHSFLQPGSTSRSS